MESQKGAVPDPHGQDRRISELESRITFQEDMIEKLQRSLFEHSQAFDRLALQVDSLTTVVRLGQGTGGAEGEEPPPPHY
ncbi:MAG: SlyX family protein [Planctomycetes bacterium]|nr:SlyX family protein [Planctomycetota bacterium]